MKLLVVTDPHIGDAGAAIIGLDPSARLEAVLEHAMAHQGNADHLVVLGDLTHHGRAAQYARLRDALRRVSVPYTLMLGNHDDRAAFQREFGRADGFEQSVVQLGAYRLICLDTLDDGAEPWHSGILCPARMDWLRAELEAARQAPVVLALHHPPFDTGFDGMDRIKLRNADALFALLAEFPNVVQLLCGHVHRTIAGSAHGMPFAVFKSPCHQMPMMLGAAGSGHSVDEPGGYGIVLLGTQGVTVHFEDVGLDATQMAEPDSA